VRAVLGHQLPRAARTPRARLVPPHGQRIRPRRWGLTHRVSRWPEAIDPAGWPCPTAARPPCAACSTPWRTAVGLSRGSDPHDGRPVGACFPCIGPWDDRDARYAAHGRPGWPFPRHGAGGAAGAAALGLPRATRRADRGLPALGAVAVLLRPCSTCGHRLAPDQSDSRITEFATHTEAS